MREQFAKRRDLVCERLKAIPGLNFPVPEGAFYVFFDVRAYLGKTFGGVTVSDSMGFCTAALEQAHVNFVPGAAFGAEGFARMSFATDEATLRDGLDVFAAWLKTGEAKND
jgi:aspartate aminotransferase